MFGKLLKFELFLHTRQISFWIAVLVMTLFGFLSSSTDFITLSLEGGEKVKTNGALPLALQISFLSLLSLFFAAVFVVNGVMRDETHKTLEIIHATPINTRDMVISRMIGAWAATVLCIIAAVIGILAGQFAPWADQESFGPFNIIYYLHPLLVFAFINALLVTGIYTVIAALSRNKSIVYVSAVGLLAANIGTELFIGEDGSDLITSLADPFGFAPLELTAEFWPAAEQNTRLVPLDGLIGLNRLVWSLAGLAMFALAFPFFKRGTHSLNRKGKTLIAEAETGKILLRPATQTQGFGTQFKGFLKRFAFEYLTTVRSIAFMILIGIALVLFGINVYAQMAFIPDPILPTSTQMAFTVLGSFGLSMLIIIVFFGGEIIWRDRVAGIHEIIDATPVHNASLLSAKWLALMAVIASLIIVGMTFGMIMQLIIGGGEIPVNIGVYLKFGFMTFGAGFLLQAIMAMFVQNFTPNRIFGMLLAAGVLILFLFIINNLPFFHPLMDYGSLGAGQPSEMSGFRDLTRFKWFFLYWGSLALLMGVLSVWMWRRGLQVGLIKRIKDISKRITPASGGLAALALAGFIGSGAYIFKSYNIDNDYRNSKANERRQVAYEKLVKPMTELPLPMVRSVEADVRFFPSKREALIGGAYDIENATDEPISTLYLNMPTSHEEDVRKLEIAGARYITDGEHTEDLAEHSIREYRFDPPLAPGHESRITFETFYHAPRLGDGSRIDRNGTFLNNWSTMPSLGINDNFMTNPDKRRKYGLPEAEKAPDRTDMEARQHSFISNSSDYVDFKARICTDAGQIPIAPGKLMREYEKDGQNCRDYQAINPILNFFSFMSADYAVKKDVWNNPNGEDVDLRIYYHAAHDFNVDLMIDAMKSSLDTFTTTFGPYQYSQIRIMEFPYASFAQAFAGTVPFSENIGFVRNPGDPEDNESVDLATYVTMHEIGHQWFAHQIVAAQTKGYNILSEGLTENAALTAYENDLGWQKARRLLEQRAIQTYLTGRVADRDKETPLAKAENQQYLIYNKANWVFWGLKQYIGEEKMQNAIKAFLGEFGSKGPPYPTTLELIDYLREAAGDDYQQLITDYWDRITFWELKFGESRIKAMPNSEGGYDLAVALNVDKKIASEEDGKEVSVSEMEGEALDEWVEIGFYNKDPKDTLGDEWMHLERVRIKDADTSINVSLKNRPTHVLLDPRRLLMERNVKDNVKALPGELASAN